MAFENRTIESVYTIIIEALEQELNTSFKLLPKSFVRVLAKVMAGVFITLYKQQGYIFLQLFVDTATFDEIEVLGRRIRPLVQWGELVGVGSPSEATNWAGVADFTVVQLNTILQENTQLKSSSTGKIYVTTESRFLQNAVESISVKCLESGTAGNLSINDELLLVNAIAAVERKAIVSDINNVAIDSETEDSYRGRVRNRWREQPQGGSLVDYRRWASEVAQVANTYIYKDVNSASGVIIYVVGTEGQRVLPDAVLQEVGLACTYDPVTGVARKPIGAVLDPDNDGTFKNIKNVNVTSFTVSVYGYEGDDIGGFQASALASVGAYFDEREPYVRGLGVDSERTDRITDVNIYGILNEIAESQNAIFTDVVISSEGTDWQLYTLGEGEVADLADLTVSPNPPPGA